MNKVKAYCRETGNQPIIEQLAGLRQRLQGHYRYYGVRGNYAALSRFLYEVRMLLMKSYRRRSGHHAKEWTWERFDRILAQNPLLKPRIMTVYA